MNGNKQLFKQMNLLMVSLLVFVVNTNQLGEPKYPYFILF